jgi:hypothetical protein
LKGVDYMAEFRDSKSAHVKRVFFIGDPCPPDAAPYSSLHALAAAFRRRRSMTVKRPSASMT